MTAASETPEPPEGLQAAGRGIWAAVVADYELEAHEQALLTELCRVKDRLDALDRIVAGEGELPDGRVHPALVEARQLGIAFARLAAALRLPAGDEGDEQQGARRPQRRVGARWRLRVGVVRVRRPHLGAQRETVP